MPRKKEFSEDLRLRVVTLHLAGIGYRLISKSLDIHQSTVRHIVHKWRRFGTVATLHRSGRPAKIATKEPRRNLDVDAESESLPPKEICKEPGSPPTTSAKLSSPTSVAHLKVILVKTEDEDQGYSPEQKPVHSPDQHTAGPTVPQQGSTRLPPSPDLCTSRSVAGSPPCTSTATSPGPLASPLPSSAIPSHVTHSSQSSIDSVSFWKSCNAAGCTQAIFADFFNEMNKISSRIQSDQASQEDYDLALKVMADSGKLAQLVANQQKELQRKQTELKKAAAAAVKEVLSTLKR